MKRRVIYNDDFRTAMSYDQIEFGMPSSVDEWRRLIERVRGTRVTTYVMDSIEFDNKIYFATERGIDWAEIDFDSYQGLSPEGRSWKDGSYSLAARVIRKMRRQGHEPLQVFIDSCRDMGMEALAGIRMNDCHGLEPLSVESPDVSFFLKEHPEYAFPFPGADEPSRLADYSHKGLRDYRFAVIQELLDKFDYDGIELNWLRWPFLFRPDYLRDAYGYLTEERFAELAPIMTRWMAEIRLLLDDMAGSKGKDRMCFGVRVPETPEICRAVGMDLPAWIREAKLDYIVPSGFHSTNFNIPVEQFKSICRDSGCAVCPSLFPNVCQSPKTTRAYQTEVYAAAAQNYYGAGADGVEVFNHFHPACKVIGLPFNAEALNVIASPEAAAGHPIHHYYVMYSASPYDVPDIATVSHSGFRGTRLSETRQKFEFPFGEDLAGSPRELTRFRFKIFDMTPADGAPTVLLNDQRLRCEMTWRRRLVYRHTHAPSTTDHQAFAFKRVGWHTAGDSAALELLAGEVVQQGEQAEMLEVVDTPAPERPEMLRGEGEGLGYDVFMLVEADLASVPPSALRKGLNRLWVNVGTRRDGAKLDLYMGELEIVTCL